MVLQFFLIKDIDRPTGIETVRDQRKLARLYLTGWFPIDLVSILPFDMLGCWMDTVDTLKKLRFLRMFRLLRLVKLVRLFRSSQILQRWEASLNISNKGRSMMTASFYLFLGAHWMSCAWGLLGR